MSDFNSFFVLLVCCSVIRLTIFVTAYESCLTPDQKSGECKDIHHCASLYSLLMQRPVSAGTLNILRKSHCGFVGHYPKVCCPPQPNPATNNEPIVVDTRHIKNVRSDLLPDRTVCGLSTEDRIYGGQIADLWEFPWMALIEYQKPNGKRGFYCGGVLINKRYILTAAHCLKGDGSSKWKLLSVRLGEYNTQTDVDCIDSGYSGKYCSDPPLNIPVEEMIAHEDYTPLSPNQHHDIGLLRLSREVPYSDYVQPICLPISAPEMSKTYVGQNLFVAGWGSTENSSNSNVKLKLQLSVKNDVNCSAIYNGANIKLGQGQFCAGGEKGRDSCRGDSGGPLMAAVGTLGEINWHAVGVVSFGPFPCGKENWPGVYTKVSKYANWIVSKLKP